MSFSVEPMREEHLLELKATVQPMQSDFSMMLEKNLDQFFCDMQMTGPCVSFLDGPRVLGVAGLIVFPHTGRSTLWCAYAENLARSFASIFKTGMRLLLAEDWRRLEAWIDPAFPASKRFARLAGFEYEGTMRKFWSDGSDRELWARVR